MAASRRVGTRSLVALALTAILAGRFTEATAQPDAVFEFGTDPGALHLLEDRGVHTKYTQLWVGAWLHHYGWLGLEDGLRAVHASGRTPVIQLYYWGNDLNETCFRQGCEGHGGLRKDQAGWDRMITELTPRLQNEFQGEPVVIVLETEFNKHLRTSEDLDAALALKADQLHQGYPNATVVLGFGNWGREDWSVFDRAADRADEIGLQLMRGSVRDTPDLVRSGPDSLLEGAQEAQRLFQKPIFVSDVAFSSHGGAEYEQAQADAIRRLFELAPELREAGVHAIVYRSILDNPTADTSDYYGEAERHFGLVWIHNRTAKPAFEALVEGLEERERPPLDPEPKTATPAPALDSPTEWLSFTAPPEAPASPSRPEKPFVEAWLDGLLLPP